MLFASFYGGGPSDVESESSPPSSPRYQSPFPISESDYECSDGPGPPGEGFPPLPPPDAALSDELSANDTATPSTLTPYWGGGGDFGFC